MFALHQEIELTTHWRRLCIAALAATALVAALAAAALWQPSIPTRPAQPPPVEVVFRPMPVLPPKPKAAPAPVARPKVQVAARPAALVAPKEIVKEKPPEAPADQAVAEAPVAVGGTGTLTPGAVLAEQGEGDETGTAGAVTQGPVDLPEEAEPPEEDEGNVAPSYPDQARAGGIEGLVVLKIVVERDGSVGRVQVMKGEEPFLASALAAVRGWRYRPARIDGQEAAVFKIVKIPFRIRS